MVYTMPNIAFDSIPHWVPAVAPMTTSPSDSTPPPPSPSFGLLNVICMNAQQRATTTMTTTNLVLLPMHCLGCVGSASIEITCC